MAVVLFHAGFSAVPGGFVGVDVFFVISGYLITGLIINKLRQGEFSFWEFYARRTRRIFPALFVMMGRGASWRVFRAYALRIRGAR